MSDDVFEIKPELGIPGIRLNVRALIRRLTTKAKTDPVAIVASRFLQLFEAHGVPIPQIPRLIPQITLDKLRTVETILPALTGGVLDQTARLFRVRRPWIEGATESLYDCLWCYKRPGKFSEDFAASKVEGVFHPIRALFSAKTLDMKDSREQPVALILVEKVADLDDEHVLRYRIYRDDWDWGYWKCRIQLKAMARLVDKHLGLRVPLYRTDEKTLVAIRSGFRVPSAPMVRHPVEDLSLEDFGLGADETRCSKEAEELPTVIEYIKNSGLDDIARGHLRSRDGVPRQNSTACAPQTPSTGP